MKLFVGKPKAGEKLNYELQPGRGAWIQLIKGFYEREWSKLEPGDGLAIMDEAAIKMIVDKDAEFVVLICHNERCYEMVMLLVRFERFVETRSLLKWLRPLSRISKC